MPFHWLVERRIPGQETDTVTEEAFGDDAYLQLLTHQDVLDSGRVKCIALEGDGPPIAVELTPDETLVCLHRRPSLVGTPADANPVMTWIVLGAKKRDGSGRYLFIAPGGAVMMSSDFNAV